MDPATRRLIESIHQSPYRCVLALTGGGTTAAAALLEVPGGSRTILEVIVPYGENALLDFLGRRPEQFCSSETSAAMARRAHERACWLAPGVPVVGLGCTASLATDRPKHGEHRLHVGCCRGSTLCTYSLVLTKNARDRAAEEDILDRVILKALAGALQIEEHLDIPLLQGEEIQVDHAGTDFPRSLFSSKSEVVYVSIDGQWRTRSGETTIAAVLPGSFNPIHDGHWQLAAVAERLLGSPVVFELSIDNPDKPSLPEEEVRRRLAQFAWRAPAVLTRAPIFADKARLCAGATFIIGVDTAVRIIAPRYYAGEAALAAAMKDIRAHGCRFLVGGRVDPGGEYQGLEDIAVPAEFRDLFSGIPEGAFRVDLSSSTLRAKDQHAAQKEAQQTG